MHFRSTRMPSRRTLVTTVVLFVGLAYFFSPQLYRGLDRVRQTHPWSFQHSVAAPFEPTTGELACLQGEDPDTLLASSGGSKAPIPNTVHFIFGLRNPLNHPGAGRFDFLCYLALRSALVALKPDEVRLHYTYLSEPPSADAGADPLTNPWIARLARSAGSTLKLVHHPPDEFDQEQSGHWQAAHVSDVLRLQLLRDHGGIYLDIDAFALRPWGALLTGPRDAVLGHEGGNRWGLCNAIMAARPKSRFVEKWLGEYKDADLSKEWNYHSVLLPKELAATDDLKNEVCALSPDAFFWPTWTWNHIEWMHEKLSKKQSDKWHEAIETNGGSLFTGQVAYHAWNQMAYDRYLKGLTPSRVRSEDTRFNLLMRRFMEDDL